MRDSLMKRMKEAANRERKAVEEKGEAWSSSKQCEVEKPFRENKLQWTAKAMKDFSTTKPTNRKAAIAEEKIDAMGTGSALKKRINLMRADRISSMVPLAAIKGELAAKGDPMEANSNAAKTKEYNKNESLSSGGSGPPWRILTSLWLYVT